MKRRAFLAASGVWLAATAAPGLPQSKLPRRVAVILPGSRAAYRSRFEALRSELKSLGYKEGTDLLIDVRWADGGLETLPPLAAEVASLRPEVIVTASSAGVSAVKKATSTIPIVFATSYNPVEQGFVKSLHRPGGNVTGIVVYAALAEKIVEVAREAFPQAQRLAILVHEPDPSNQIALKNFLSSVERFKLQPLVVRVRGPQNLEQGFSELAEKRADILYLPDSPFQTTYRDEIIARAVAKRLPLLTGVHETTAAGGLLSYGTSREENYRRAAILVDKILRGATPAELPIQQPERFQLIVNRKTARSIGVTLSPITLLRADRFID